MDIKSCSEDVSVRSETTFGCLEDVMYFVGYRLLEQTTLVELFRKFIKKKIGINESFYFYYEYVSSCTVVKEITGIKMLSIPFQM